MKGDFSHWQFDPNENLNGVLQQQGRVLLDRDWNEQTRITQHWRDIAGSDIIGPGVAAVPVTDPNGFKVVQANVTGTSPNQRVELLLQPGRIWADGQLAYLPPASPGSVTPVMRVADYLLAPIDPTPGSIATIAAGIRDAVILEVSREELNAFQLPDRLLEPALGGPDTTERVQLRTAFKLFRLNAGENCHTIGDQLLDDPSTKGHLTVSLQPTVVVPGDCPVVLGGGYSGFEHYLYRTEIAALNAAQPAAFKWSQFNGGLVGRGQLVTTPANRIVIKANQAAILNSGLTKFYCEVVSLDNDRGTWNPTFGAEVTLSGSDLVINTVRLGAFSASNNTVFFRLWNGLELLSDFDHATPVELIDGIQLQFTPATATNYAPGDFWTFTVRAGEIVNSPVPLIDDQAPFGPRYHRVALAEIDWAAIGIPVVPPEIEDCRRRFRPLTRFDTCCTVRVGDRVHSLGDYTSIQEAVQALPLEGGTVCILPGVYKQQVFLYNLHNVTLSGCGPRTRLIAPDNPDGIDAIIVILGGSNITIESLAVEASPNGRGIYAAGFDPFTKVAQVAQSPLGNLMLDELSVSARTHAAIYAKNISGFTLRRTFVSMADVTSQEHAVELLVDDALVEHNTIEVLREASLAFSNVGTGFNPGAFNTGGLHLESLSDRVQIIDNLIRGGSGNGITLGSLSWFTDKGEPVPPENQPEQPETDPCDPTKPLDNSVDVTDVTIGDGIVIRLGAGGPLYDIRIERNRIYSMGANGISVIWFFDLRRADQFISVHNLALLGNDIRHCLRRELAARAPNLVEFSGYGGVALGDVENLIAHDNVIVDNGANWLDAVCGIFVLHGHGLDFVRNRIVNNGARTGQALSAAKHGQRGGIVIAFALPPTIKTSIGEKNYPTQNGVPAVRVHDNIVVAPLGHALAISAVGPVSVVANQFTTQAILPPAIDFAGFIAGTVMIFNVGMSNELYLQLLLFAALAKANAQAYIASAGENALATVRPGFDDSGIARLLANGQVLFDDNQVNLDLLATGLTVAVSSTAVITFDDLSFQDNQLEANLFDDFLLFHSVTLAFSQRVTGNRWKEPIYNAWLSAFTLSFTMNATTDNQATHCIIARGLPTHVVDDDNTVLLQGVLGKTDGLCDNFKKLLPQLAGRP